MKNRPPQQNQSSDQDVSGSVRMGLNVAFQYILELLTTTYAVKNRFGGNCTHVILATVTVFDSGDM